MEVNNNCYFGYHRLESSSMHCKLSILIKNTYTKNCWVKVRVTSTCDIWVLHEVLVFRKPLVLRKKSLALEKCLTYITVKYSILLKKGEIAAAPLYNYKVVGARHYNSPTDLQIHDRWYYACSSLILPLTSPKIGNFQRRIFFFWNFWTKNFPISQNLGCSTLLPTPCHDTTGTGRWNS